MYCNPSVGNPVQIFKKDSPVYIQLKKWPLLFLFQTRILKLLKTITLAYKEEKNDYVNIVSCIPCFGDCNIHLSNCHILGVYHLHNNLSKLPDFDTNYLKI